MEETFTYIIVFGLLILITMLYLFRSEKKKTLPLSVQVTGRNILKLSVEKEGKKISGLILQMNNPVQTGRFFFEMIDENRDKKIIPLHEIFKTGLKAGDNDIHIDYDLLKKTIEETVFPVKTFRFGYQLPENIKIKTHELAISKHWNIYKVDSGRYN